MIRLSLSPIHSDENKDDVSQITSFIITLSVDTIQSLLVCRVYGPYFQFCPFTYISPLYGIPTVLFSII